MDVEFLEKDRADVTAMLQAGRFRIGKESVSNGRVRIEVEW